ncbi:MAG TPA: alpha/beta hydrolase [Acidimicrobiales bacterium]
MPPVAPVPVRHVSSTDGVTLALHDLGGEGPPVLLCHPTGFLAMTWAPLAAELAGAAHCWALDFRGHGDSDAPASGDYDWARMAEDVLAVADELGLRGARGAGHSMGGAALVMAEQRRPGTFSRLWLYEPIIVPAGAGGGRRPNPMADAARRRRPWFPDRASAFDNFSAKPPLDTLAPEALQAYVDFGLRDVSGDGAVELKCRPEVEALVFDGGMEQPTFDHLGEVRCRVAVVASGDGGGPALFAPAIVEQLPDAVLERHPELTHFGPMEDPAGMAAAARAALDLG